ncbi:MAG: type II secretion system F family protein [Parcubacteria group bacterium]|nr:type II secretion system F family protein [Parcubacteria group bacterium]
MEFTYTAINKEGKREEGRAYASDKFVLSALLKKEGKTLVSAEEIKKNVFSLMRNIALFKHISMDEKIMFAHNLAAMTRAGLSLSRTLSILERQSTNTRFKDVMNALSETIKKGGTLADAMREFPTEFSPLFVSMVHAGEESGGLADALEVVGTQMKKNNELVKKVKGAMIYPFIVIGVMVLVGFVMIVKVVPTLTATFVELDVELPAATKILIAVSDALRDHFLLVLSGGMLLVLLVVYAMRTERGRQVRDTFFLRIPVIGGLIQEFNAARTARTLSSLLSSGVDIVQSLAITRDVIQNTRFKSVIGHASERIQKGIQLSVLFSEEKAGTLYPILFSEMIAVGEETGKVSDMLEEVALYYEGEVEAATKNMSTIVEPILMLIVGVVVGFFSLAMITPMYSVMSGI